MNQQFNPQDGSMYLVLPVPFRLFEGQLQVEAQAANGLDRWAEGFSHVTVGAPLIPDQLVSTLAGFVWRNVSALQHRDHIHFQPLPWAYSPASFCQHLRPVRNLIRETIAKSEHLQFAIGGMIGDWAAVAALEAIAVRRRYAIHTDRVEHEVIRNTMGKTSGLRRARMAIELPLMKRYHRHVIERCSLGLWHGDDCYRAYAPWCRESHLIHDVHTKESDLVDTADLEQKFQDIRSSPTLNLCYVGRLDPMKAPLEWLRAIAIARDLGANLRASWFGEGPMLAECLAERKRLNLQDIVEFPGFLSNRAELLDFVRRSHALVFTHITPESPRNLLESLVSGTAILGYDTAYAVDLLQGHGGGSLVPIHDTQALARVIVDMASNRENLVTKTREAASNGRRFTDAAVFAERSNLIRKYA